MENIDTAGAVLLGLRSRHSVTLHGQNKSNTKTFANSCSPHPPRGTAKLVYLILGVYPPFNIKTIYITAQSSLFCVLYFINKTCHHILLSAEVREGVCPLSRLPRTSVGVLQVPGENTTWVQGNNYPQRQQYRGFYFNSLMVYEYLIWTKPCH